MTPLRVCRPRCTRACLNWPGLSCTSSPSRKNNPRQTAKSVVLNKNKTADSGPPWNVSLSHWYIGDRHAGGISDGFGHSLLTRNNLKAGQSRQGAHIKSYCRPIKKRLGGQVNAISQLPYLVLSRILESRHLKTVLRSQPKASLTISGKVLLMQLDMIPPHRFLG